MKREETKVKDKSYKIDIYITKRGQLFKTTDLVVDVPKQKYKKSEKEIELIQSYFDISLEDAKTRKIENAYELLSDNGYIVIRVDRDEGTCSLFISEKVNDNDRKRTLEILENIEKEGTLKKYRIFNRVDVFYGKEYEMQETENFNDLKKMTDIFFRDKIGTLTSEEQEMIKRYREFDVDRILTEDDDNNLINNQNSGVVIITPDKFIGSTLKTRLHMNQIISVIRNRYYEDYKNNRTIHLKQSPEDSPDEFQTIMAEILRIGSMPMILIWIPKNINEFQYQHLRNFAYLVKAIKDQKGVDTQFMFEHKLPHNMEKSYTAEEFIDWIEKHNDKFVDNDILALKRTTPPESMRIGDMELGAIFNIKRNDEPTVGNKVIEELEGYALAGQVIVKGNIQNGILRQTIGMGTATSRVKRNAEILRENNIKGEDIEEPDL